jgi:hypothetical protein
VLVACLLTLGVETPGGAARPATCCASTHGMIHRVHSHTTNLQHNSTAQHSTAQYRTAWQTNHSQCMHTAVAFTAWSCGSARAHLRLQQLKLPTPALCQGASSCKVAGSFKHPCAQLLLALCDNVRVKWFYCTDCSRNPLCWSLTVGLLPLHLLAPALPSTRFLFWGLDTAPMVARHLRLISRCSPAGTG